jgi:hypothetical protein
MFSADELLLQENKMLSAYLNRLHPTLGDIDESFFADGGLATMQNAFLGAPDDDSKRYVLISSVSETSNLQRIKTWD